MLIGGDNGGIMGNYVTEVVDAFARSGSTIRSVASSITAGVASLTVTGGVSGTTYIIWAILAVGYNTNSI